MATATRRIPAAPGAIWDLLVQTHHWPSWGPTVSAVDGPDRIGPGATGRVRTAVGVWLPFEVTEWTEGRSWAWRVAGVPATGHHVTAAPGGGADVRFTAPFWAFAYVPVLHLGLRRIEDLAVG